jgi:WD40 repeat protein
MTDRNIQWGGKTCLYLSADSKLAVSGHELGRLKLYNVETGKLIWTYRRHGIISHDLEKNIRPTIEDEEVNSVYISRDNRFILSGGADKTLKLWEIGNDDSPPAYTSLEKDYLRNFQGHQEGVLSVCLTLNNEFALSGSADKTLKLWRVSTGECLKTLEGHQDAVNAVCLSSDGKFALSGSTDMTIKYWDLETGECLNTFQKHTQPINSIFLSVDNQFLLSGSDDKTVRLWDVETGECLKVFEGHRNRVTSVCLASNNQYAISADGEVIKIWFLDWELEERQPTDWDEGARLYLDIFLKQHTPYVFSLPNHRQVTEEEITQSLTREGIPQWKDKDFQDLLYTLACAGYGWLNPDGVREQLQAVKKEYCIVITQNLINETIKKVNYTRLVDALAQGKWQEANEETCNLIRIITNCKQGTNINIRNWQNFPKEHLLMTNLLWLYYSNHKFGFSIQKKIFKEVNFNSIRQWNKVGDHLSWRKKNKWLSDEEINFTAEAPEGHLPVLGTSLNLPLWWMRCGAYVNLMCSNAWKNLGSDDDYLNIDIDEILRQFD